MDIANPEVQQFLRSLHDNHVRYMLVGGMATVFYGHVRTTQDLDLWIQETIDNKKRLVRALDDVQVPGAANFEKTEMIPGWSTITVGEQGFVADFMSYTKAFAKEDFDKCYRKARNTVLLGIPITVIDIEDLLREKKELGRPKDIDDVYNLEKIIAARKKSKG